jgi:di/tricarboxylate transporter
LLIQASEAGFAALRDTEAVFIVDGLDGSIRRQRHTWVAVAIMLCVVAGTALTGLPIVVFALAGAALMIGTHCLRVDEAFRSLDVKVLLLLVGTIPLGLALDSTGTTRDFVAWLLATVGDLHPAVILSVLYLLTSVITEVLSNKATAILLAPVAIQLATQLGVSPLPFLFAICFAASASFMTPFGYPTNLIVMGPGGYKFLDYSRLGVPLNVIMWIIASLLIPVIWPF